MKPEDCYELGYIVKPKGLDGTLVAFLDVDYPQNYNKLKSIFINIDGTLVPYKVQKLDLRGSQAVLKLEDVDEVEVAKNLKSKTLHLPLSSLPELDPDQFYYHQILGYTIIDQNKGVIGTVKNVFTLPHNDLIATDHLNKEILIPVNDDIIHSVDHSKKEIRVTLPDGLLEVYL